MNNERLRERVTAALKTYQFDLPEPAEQADRILDESATRSGTIQVRVSPFVYSAWGFGVLMPKPKQTVSDQDGWQEF